MTDVLIVVDETELRHMLPRLLRAEGYRVTIAFNVVEAFELAQAYTPDAIVLDLVLPQVSGWSFIKLAKQLARVRDVPIVALSLQPEAECAALLALGCAACLGKPLQLGIFLETVQQLVRQQRASSCCR